MSIVDYPSLQTAVGNWLHRSDLSTFIPDFITLAESKLATELNTRFQYVLSSGIVTTAGNGYVTLPPDMLEVRRVKVISSPNSVLEYMTPENLDTIYNDSSNQGQPESYTILGTEAQFGPVPDAVYTVEFYYKQRIPSLAVNNTNWLITNFPNMYLWGSILAGQVYLINDDRIPAINAAYQDGLQSINAVNWNRGASLQMVVS
jgi:hypothetical protein